MKRRAIGDTIFLHQGNIIIMAPSRQTQMTPRQHRSGMQRDCTSHQQQQQPESQQDQQHQEVDNTTRAEAGENAVSNQQQMDTTAPHLVGQREGTIVSSADSTLTTMSAFINSQKDGGYIMSQKQEMDVVKANVRGTVFRWKKFITCDSDLEENSRLVRTIMRSLNVPDSLKKSFWGRHKVNARDALNEKRSTTSVSIKGKFFGKSNDWEGHG